jgi:hypothetical protein
MDVVAVVVGGSVGAGVIAMLGLLVRELRLARIEARAHASRPRLLDLPASTWGQMARRSTNGIARS